jgi:hypothetical protein
MLMKNFVLLNDSIPPSREGNVRIRWGEKHNGGCQQTKQTFNLLTLT